MGNAEKISNIILALRGLFKGKDKLVGVDDWDIFIGCLMLLEEVENSIKETETTAEGE